jgi:FixJ family two-component response regulator
MSHQLTVYLIDHDLGTRRSIAAQLGAIGAEAWPFASGAEFLEITDHLVPACVLLDMEMPHMSGLDVMRELARREIDWPVIALSACAEIPVAVDAMKLGAIDFLQKPVRQEMLSAALRVAWAALERSLESRATRRFAQERVGRLTPREVDISLALLSGQPNKTVAHQFGISVRTVEMHRAHIMAKLGVKSLAEAAVLATHAGLALTPSPPPAQPREPSRLLLGQAGRGPLRQAAVPFMRSRQASRSAV